MSSEIKVQGLSVLKQWKKLKEDKKLIDLYVCVVKESW